MADEPQVEFTAIQGSSDTAKLLFFLEGKAVVMRTKRVSCHLPLGPIAPPSFDFAALRTLFQECEPDAETRYIINIFTQDTITKFITTHTDFISAVKATHTVIRERIIADAVDELCQQQTLTQVVREPALDAFNLPAFLIPKHDATSSRLIIDCRPLNRLLTEFPLPKMPLPSIADIVQTGVKYEFLTTRMPGLCFINSKYREHSRTDSICEWPTGEENLEFSNSTYCQWDFRWPHQWLSMSRTICVK